MNEAGEQDSWSDAVTAARRTIEMWLTGFVSTVLPQCRYLCQNQSFWENHMMASQFPDDHEGFASVAGGA